ncbi:hypothetical protein GGI25_005971 [Coemansia spiralis]|uniref:Uncharacterized protein n=2 Tax=Coemansia TaxID=4863 RepID=A0A9W8KU65_9FUNG|nr:hypothetical protein BX070DRAFT_229511 [Coemansia spiralis]KAJ1991694.1 hypothetical protein EDC05_003319 [Coemansia umbellata]KAJ2619120.1 hypothetical protein GGI26_006085 [Coemansia sp. RSA 1358]KAJ2669998.1 hypothetical protein GGI25_005971 [Coemansia spiralis]
MTENHNALHSDVMRQNQRVKSTDTVHEQKIDTGLPNKRKVILSEQPPNLSNQQTTGAHGAAGTEKASKKVAKVDIPISLDIHPFSTHGEFASPQSAMDKMLSAKANSTTASDSEHANNSHSARFDGAATPDYLKSPTAGANGNIAAQTPMAGKEDIAVWRTRAKKAETELLTLKHQLLETKAELKAAEDRLREKDSIIKDQGMRIDELIESRVPLDDMDDIVAENNRLQLELKENEALLADCQKLLEEYAADEDDQQIQLH